MSIPPAWHPDPTGRHDHRWWDGTRWTEHVADAGVSSVDPIEQAGQPGAGAMGATDAGIDEGASRAGFTSPGGGAEGGGATTGGADGDSVTSPGNDWGSPAQTGAAEGIWGSARPAAEGQGWPAGPTGQGQAAGTGSDGLAIAALVLGIFAVAFSWVPFLGILSALAGIVAIVLGAVAMSRVRKSGRKGRGFAITGLVTGIVSVVLMLLVHVWLFQGAGGVFSDYEQCLEITGDEENCRQLTDLFGTADLRVG